MEDKPEEKRNSIHRKNKKSKEKIKKKEEKVNINDRNIYQIDINKVNEEEDYYYNSKRSYSCKVGDSKNKKFIYNIDEIKLNIDNKLKYLKTPKIRPKKSHLIPKPIDLGFTSCSNKKSKFNLINDENIILSEGEESLKDNSSDSMSNNDDEKENIRNLNIIKDISIKNENNNNNNDNDNDNNNSINKINNVNINNLINIQEFKIEEENDEYNEYGELVLKKLRKNFIQTKKTILKNIKKNNEFDNFLKEKYNTIKENVLNQNEKEEDDEVPKNLCKTIGFTKDKNKNLPILDFLRKNSSKIYS